MAALQGISSAPALLAQDDVPKRGRRATPGTALGEPSTELSRSLPAPSSAHFALERHGYVLHETIGSGGYSKVKIAVHSTTGLKVAVKIIKKLSAPPGYLRKFLPREIQTLSIVNHSRICKLLEVIDSPQRVYLVMQLAPRGDLLDHINNNGPLPPDEIRRLFLQILAAVYHCHSHQIVHRDLKCENMLLDADGNVLVSDFGFATCVSSHRNQLMTHCGSYAYAAPEVLEGRPYIGAAADVWSLGVVLYAMACGRLPFSKAGYGARRQKVAGPQSVISLHIPKTICKPLQNLLRQMLCASPSARITVGDILRHPWLRMAAADAQDVHPEWGLPPYSCSGSRRTASRSGRGRLFLGASRRSAPNEPPHEHRGGKKAAGAIETIGEAAKEQERPSTPPSTTVSTTPAAPVKLVKRRKRAWSLKLPPVCAQTASVVQPEMLTAPYDKIADLAGEPGSSRDIGASTSPRSRKNRYSFFRRG